jgi:hypothetical protein
VWQDLHHELSPRGVDVVTIALDAPDAAAPWLEPIAPDGPVALIDEALRTTDAFGWVNVPSAIWYDERGTIVRGPEVAFLKPKQTVPIPPDAPDAQREMLGYINAFPNDAATWMAALRDWVERGADSPYALTPDEVRDRSREFGLDAARATAHYTLAEHLRTSGHTDDAIAHQRRAHELDPQQWTRKRQAWALAGGPERFGTSFIDEMRALGPESFYPPVRFSP